MKLSMSGLVFMIQFENSLSTLHVKVTYVVEPEKGLSEPCHLAVPKRIEISGL